MKKVNLKFLTLRRRDNVMKKFISAIGLLAILFIFTGCGPSPQEQYKEELQNQSKMNYESFKFTLDNVSIKSGDKNADSEDKLFNEVIEKQFKGMSLNGSILRDKKSKDILIKLNTNLLGQDLDFELFTSNKTKDYYVKADSYNQVVGFIQQFSPDKYPLQEIDQKMIEGKYILITKEIMDATSGETSEVTKDSGKKLIKFLDTLDKDSFKKDGDKITHRFTKKELLEYSKTLTDKEDKESQKVLKEQLDKLDKITVDLTVDTKNHTKIGKVSAKNTVETGDTYTVKLSAKQNAKDSNTSVKIPSKANTISFEEFAKEAVGSVTSDIKMTDEDMKEFLDAVRENKDSIDFSTAENYKETYREYLTDEQYKEFVKVLDEIVAEKAKT